MQQILFKRSLYFINQNKKRYCKKYSELVEPNQNLLILFYAFETLAKEEANTKIPAKTIEGLEEKYKDLIWKMVRFGEHTTFFFYTQSQLKSALKTGKTAALKEEYFEQLKHFDEFNYFNLANFNAVFDSKESFDKNYDGSWRAYYS
ncbi:MAG: hypothetical protein EOO47_11580 [Flavobacterium sp.]|nr:MAG: hypothetical protein EOO47_11580 [Flavobacterium sp.]